jgi:hypothetical protein
MSGGDIWAVSKEEADTVFSESHVFVESIHDYLEILN